MIDPDGTERALLEVPAYDFNWQTSYEFREPPILPAGTKIHLTLAWDNSADNPYNPDPTMEVRFGEPTTAEMMFGFMRFAYVDEPEEYSVDAATLAEYAGEYAFDEESGFTIALKGKNLVAKFPGNPSFPISPQGEDKFEFTLINMKLDFERDATGEVVAMVMTFQDDVDRAMKVVAE